MATNFQALIDKRSLEIGDGYRAKNSELGGDGLIFLRAVHLQGTGFDFTDVDRFHRSLTARVSSKLAKPNDVVITTKGNSTGRTGFVRAWMPEFVYSPHLSFWRSSDTDVLDPLFLRQWARGPEFFSQLEGLKSQTDMAPYLSLRDQRRLRISLPSIEVQRAIARILGALDDKIELNREMNRTLEATAHAIFRSWFVDFDPVVAKADGRKPFGMTDDLAALFPDRFVESELGPIPEGWEVSTIGESVETVGGSTPSTKDPRYWEGGDFHWATPKDLSGRADYALLETERKITEAGLARISSGLLPRGTVLMSSRAPVGYLAIAEVPTAVNQGFIAMRCEGLLGRHYVLQWARQEMDQIKTRAGGTTFAEISKSSFRPIPILVPGKPVHDAWHRLADALHSTVVHNLRESQALAALRDLLLPKLLSGEIRVAEAEERLEAAGA